MALNTAPDTDERPATRFSRLWETSLAIPDVFAFLRLYPDLPPIDRLDVLLVDQKERWRRRQPLPLRIYFSAFPDIAAEGEMVRALADGDRHERRRSAGLQSDTAGMKTLDILSEALTQRVEGESERADTEVERPVAIQVEPAPGIRVAPEDGLLTTKGPTALPPTSDRLSFALDETHHLQSEAESLRAMLNTVRFTLVRRVGSRRDGGRLRGLRPGARRTGRAQDHAAGRPDRPGPVQAGVPLLERHHPSQPGQSLRALRGRRPLVLHHGAGRGMRLSSAT